MIGRVQNIVDRIYATRTSQTFSLSLSISVWRSFIWVSVVAVKRTPGLCSWFLICSFGFHFVYHFVWPLRVCCITVSIRPGKKAFFTVLYAMGPWHIASVWRRMPSRARSPLKLSSVKTQRLTSVGRISCWGFGVLRMRRCEPIDYRVNCILVARCAVFVLPWVQHCRLVCINCYWLCSCRLKSGHCLCTLWRTEVDVNLCRVSTRDRQTDSLTHKWDVFVIKRNA